MSDATGLARRVITNPAEFVAQLTGWLPSAPPDEVAQTRNDLVDIDGYVRRNSKAALIEARRAARLTEWEMAQRWPVKSSPGRRDDDRPAISNAFDIDSQLWQFVYAVGLCDRGWLLDSARTAAELTQRAVRAHVDTMSTGADMVDSLIDYQPDTRDQLPALGSWIELGPHRLYCGDSRADEFQTACEGAAFAFADPPYGVVKAAWDDLAVWDHDWLLAAAPLVAVTPGVVNLPHFLHISRMRYRWALAAWLDNGMTRGDLGYGSWILTLLFGQLPEWLEKMQDFRRVSIGGHPGNAAHPSRKPARLLQWLIGSFTLPGQTVIDPFLGSGTTLLMAEQAGRRCVGAELDPGYCAAVRTRYQAMTG
jgi:hypothetical protein